MLVSPDQMKKLEAIVEELERREYERILNVMLVKPGVIRETFAGATLQRVAVYLGTIGVDSLDERPDLKKAFKEAVNAIRQLQDMAAATAGPADQRLDQRLAKLIAALNRALKTLIKNDLGDLGQRER
jgi:hypothetical protein